MNRCRGWIALAVGLLAACQSTSDELSGIAEVPPLDYAVLVTGGARLGGGRSHGGTFAGAGLAEPIAMAAIVDVLQRGRVFQRVAIDDDAAARSERRDQLLTGATTAEARQFLERARAQGYDLLLVVEELADGPIEEQGINGRWPVTLATWFLLGIGMFIPDHTFESRATLRITVRDLQTGQVLHDPLLPGGPIDLSLVERGSFLGILTSIIVPPFWVGDDPESVATEVRSVVQRRLLLSLARDLKSDSVRQRLLERSIASLTLADLPEGLGIAVDARESLSVARLRPVGTAVDDAVLAAFERALLESMRREGDRFRYAAPLPAELRGAALQVLVGTIRGNVASATFAARRP